MSRRLTKAGAERLLAAIDTPELYESYLEALRFVLASDEPGHDEPDGDVLRRAATITRWTPDTIEAIRLRDSHTLAKLAIELCELRELRSP